MILFTGSGIIAEEYRKSYPCETISARAMSDSELSHYIEKADTIIHNAANINCQDFTECVQDNFTLTKRIIDLAYQVKPSIRFIYISSMSMLETCDAYKMVADMSLYAYSKYLGEIYCLKHPLQKNVTSVRFSTIFYKNQYKDGLSKLISDAAYAKKITLYNEGTAKRDFIPLGIAVDYLNKIVKAQHINGPVNIVSGHAVSFGELAIHLQQNASFQIDNINSTTPPSHILCDFSKNDITTLGEISFDLKKELEHYFYQLTNESIDI